MSRGPRRTASVSRAPGADPVRTKPRAPVAPRPHLIVLAGLPGVGKSEVARALARRLGALWLRVDTIEASLLRAGIPRSFETGLAAYLAARDLAEEHLRNHGDVVIDAVNGVEPARQMWRDLARNAPADLRVVEVRCEDREEHRRRVEGRVPPTPPLPTPTWEEVLNREYLPWTESILVVDGARPPRSNADRILRSIGRQAGGPRAPRPAGKT